MDFIIRLSLLLSNSNSDKEIYSGNPDVLCNCLDSLSIPLSVYRDFELTESYIATFEKIYEVFVTNKRLHGPKFLGLDILYSLFFPWQCYVSHFCKVALVNNDNIGFFTQGLDRMFDALEWYVDNISSFVDNDNIEDYPTIGHEVASCVKSLFFKDESPLSINNLDNYIQRLQAMLLKTYSEDYQEEFIEDAIMLIEKYIDIHKPQYNTYVKPFETTPLMRFLNHPGYEELHIEIEEEAKAKLDQLYAQNNLRIDHDTGIVSILNPEVNAGESDRIYENSLNEEEWEEIDIEEMLRPDWMRPKTYEPTYEIVRQKRSTLDKVLTDLDTRISYLVDFRDRYSEDYYDMIETYRNLTFSIVEDMIALGEKGDALTLLKNAEIIFCRPIIEIDARYGIRVETAKYIKSLSDFYEYINEEERAIVSLKPL